MTTTREDGDNAQRSAIDRAAIYRSRIQDDDGVLADCITSLVVNPKPI
ncbi:hypothetical protein [Leptolyngbya sp. FACHB-1624]|nr:hypothetical protein [Leptolyngbya sp. FACHB-1624]